MSKSNIEAIKIIGLAGLIVVSYLTLFLFIPFLIWGVGGHLLFTTLVVPLILILLFGLGIVISADIYKIFIENTIFDDWLTKQIKNKLGE